MIYAKRFGAFMPIVTLLTSLLVTWLPLPLGARHVAPAVADNPANNCLLGVWFDLGRSLYRQPYSHPFSKNQSSRNDSGFAGAASSWMARRLSPYKTSSIAWPICR